MSIKFNSPYKIDDYNRLGTCGHVWNENLYCRCGVNWDEHQVKRKICMYYAGKVDLNNKKFRGMIIEEKECA